MFVTECSACAMTDTMAPCDYFKELEWFVENQEPRNPKEVFKPIDASTAAVFEAQKKTTTSEMSSTECPACDLTETMSPCDYFEQIEDFGNKDQNWTDFVVGSAETKTGALFKIEKNLDMQDEGKVARAISEESMTNGSHEASKTI